MKDHTFDARNDEMRARTQRGATAQERANAASRPLRVPNPVPRADAAALAEVTDLAIDAASPAPRAKKVTKKNANDVPAKAAKGTRPAPAAQETQPPDAPKPAKKKATKTIDAAIAPTKPAKVDWLDTGLDRTGKLTVDELARGWIEHLEEGGKTTASTIASYANDLKSAIAFFGADQLVSTINRGSIERFNVCDGVMKLRSGEPKAMPTILKMRRAFRMALEWARENKVVAHADGR